MAAKNGSKRVVNHSVNGGQVLR